MLKCWRLFLKSSCYIDVTFIGRQPHKKGNDIRKITLYTKRLLPSHHLQCHRGRCRSSFHHHENDDHHTLIFSSYYDHYHHDPRQQRSSKHIPTHVFTRRKITLKMLIFISLQECGTLARKIPPFLKFHHRKRGNF